MKRCPYCRCVVRTEEDLQEHLADCELAAVAAGEDNEKPIEDDQRVRR